MTGEIFKDTISVANQLIGSFDDRKEEYNLTIPIANTTVSFKESVNGWSSFKSFVPETAVSMGNDYYTLKNGLAFYSTLYGARREPIFKGGLPLMISPPISINKNQIDDLMHRLYESLDEWQEEMGVC